MEFYNPTEEHQILRQTLAEFVREVVEPQAERQDELAQMNRSLMSQCGEMGLLGVTIPESWGGAGMDTTAAVIVHEELARSDPGFTLAYLAHSILFVHNFFHTSNEDQKKRYLSSLLSGEMIGCMGMTEPSCGTDVLAMATTAVKEGEHYRINGRKTFITNASEASLFLVYAQEEGRISAFVIEREFPGFSVGKKIDKMGMRASSMAELIMEDCIVPAECLLGIPGGGITSMMRNLEIERLALAAISLGIAGRCIDEMIQYSVDRTAFGKPLVKFGQIQKYIAESYAKHLAARTLVYSVAQRVNPEMRNRIDSDAAKLFAAPMAKEVADAAVQVLGGYGYCTEYKVERFLRDAKLLEIGGGTLESHQKNITRDLTRNL